ncbi:MAG TPA: hypothetical protein VFZ40_17195 [Pyrinomonadaceae bacterium]
MNFSFSIIAVLFLFLAMSVSAHPWQESDQQQNDVQRARMTANRFVEKFQATLDFGATFTEVGVSNPITGLRTAKFFKSINIEDDLVKGLNDEELTRIYRAFMNLHFLNALYYCGKPQQEVPSDIKLAINSSKFFSTLRDEGGVAPLITTKKELTEYVADMEKLAILYRKHLPPSLFNSASYKQCVAASGRPNNHDVSVRDGFEDFGVSKGSKVYVITRGLFTMYIMEEKGEMRILAFGFGN